MNHSSEMEAFQWLKEKGQVWPNVNIGQMSALTVVELTATRVTKL